MNTLGKRTSEERFNTLTHLGGVVFTLAAAWVILRLGWGSGWKNAFGTTFFTCGMLLMYAASTLYHWWLPGHGKRRLRVLDHISIYVMIAASYTPICIGVVGGALGWTVFGLLWAVALGGVQNHCHGALAALVAAHLSGYGLDLCVHCRTRVLTHFNARHDKPWR